MRADARTTALPSQALPNGGVPAESGTFARGSPAIGAPPAATPHEAPLGEVVAFSPTVVYQDSDVIVVDKGPREPTTPQGEYGGSLLARVWRMAGAENALAVHRLDVGTSGLVMFVRNPQLLAKWERVLSATSTRKIYLAAARGITPEKGTITRDLPDGGIMHAARTRYRRVAMAGGHSVLRILPEQGHPDQIRRHLAAIGHPVLGDDRYGHPITNRFFKENSSLDRSFLHCIRLEFDHPDTGERHIVEAPLPRDLRDVLERMSGADTVRFLDHKNALGSSTFQASEDQAAHAGSVPEIEVVLPAAKSDHS